MNIQLAASEPEWLCCDVSRLSQCHLLKSSQKQTLTIGKAHLGAQALSCKRREEIVETSKRAANCNDLRKNTLRFLLKAFWKQKHMGTRAFRAESNTSQGA